MLKIIEISLWGAPVGYLEYDTENGTSMYEIASEHPYGRKIAPLHLKNLPDNFAGPFNHEFFSGLPSFIADSLPDAYGKGVLQEWIDSNKVNDTKMHPPLQLCYVGKRGMGALEYAPPIIPVDRENLDLDLRELTKISNEILKGSISNKYPKEALNSLFAVGTTAGGARSKAVVSMNLDTKEIIPAYTAVDNFVPVIIKFAGPDSVNETRSNEHGKIEYAYYLMAQDCGIHMHNSFLLEVDGLHHFVTERFDRTREGEKVHMLTYSGMTGVDPRTQHDLREVYNSMLELRLGYDEIEQMHLRMIFNVVMKNYDCHLKNHAFLLPEGENWKLSPAYDLTFPFDTNRVWYRPFPISVNGKNDNISANDFEVIGKEYGLKSTTKLIEKVNRVAKSWMDYADRVSLSPAKAETINNHLEPLKINRGMRR